MRAPATRWLDPLFGRSPALAQVRRAAFLDGMRAFTPAAIATGVWALVTSVATVRMGMSAEAALAMSGLVYAGSAQLAALPLIVAGAPAWLVLLTASIVNLRFVIFSAGLHAYFRHLSLWRRLLLGYLTGDVSYLLAIRRWGSHDRAGPAGTAQIWFYLGLTAANWLVWQSMSVAGILLADRIPASWGMDFVGVLALITLVVPGLTDAPSIAGVLAASVTAILARPAPLKLAVLVAVVAGVAAAMLVELARERRTAR